MKVKQKKINSPLPGFIRNFFRRRKVLSRGILAVVSLFGLAILFFAILGYGAHLKQVGQTTYFKNMVLQMTKMDFSFAKNYAKGQMHEFDDIQMDIKFKHLLRIQYLRKQALANGLITPAMKSEEFPAQMTLNGKTHNVKISLTGLVAISHLKDPVKWSFQVKVKGDDTFEGMKRFGMLRPSTRGYLTDWIGFELMKDRGLMGLRVDYVNLSVNGKPIGTYYLEERFDKYLVENNSLREGILFKIDGDLSAYQESKLMGDPGFKAQLLLIKRLWQNVIAGDLPPNRFFDMKKMAQVFAVCDLMNNKHPLAGQNMRYYFNPVTGLAEPIAREWEKLERSEVSNLRLFPEKPIPFTRHAKFVNDPILKLIYDNLEFKRHYVREVELLSQTKYLDQFLASKEDKINSLLNKVYVTWPFYELPTHKLYEHQNYMHSVLHPEEDQLVAYFNNKDHKTLQLSLHNQQYLPIEVTYVSWRDSLIFQPQSAIVIDTKEKEQPQLFRFALAENTKLPKDFLKDLKVHYNVYGLESDKRTIGVLPKAGNQKQEKESEKLAQKGTYSKFDFVKEDKVKNVLNIPAGKWTIDQDLIIPAGKKLEVAADARIDLIEGAMITSYSPVYFKGREDLPVIVMSSDSSGRGINVIQADQRSDLSHVVFDKLSAAVAEDGFLQGAITFFESPVSIYACTFSKGKNSQRYLHILNTDFSLDHSRFSNINGDAIGVDYGTGTLSNSSFVDVKQNGLATSGSKVKAEQLFFNNIGQQGVVARESSELDIRRVDIRQADIAMAATGQSKLRLTDAFLENNNVGLSTYEKDTATGAAYINAERLEIKNTASPYKLDPKARMVLDGAPLGKEKKGIVDKIKKVLQ